MQKNKMNKEKKIAIISVSIFLVLIIVAGVIIGLKIANYEGKDEIAQTPEEEIIDLRDASIELKALSNTPYGIEPNTEFQLESSVPLTEDFVKKNLLSEPICEMVVTEESSNRYNISFSEPLEANKLVRISFNTGEETLGWAFQTQKVFDVAATFPTDKGYDVPMDSGIEIYFTRDAIQPIDDYFTITPATDGQFTYLENKVVFIPDEDLYGATDYTVTIAAGYSTGDETISSSYSFGFRTAYFDQERTFYFSGNETVLNSTKAQVLDFYVQDNRLTDSEITLNAYQITDVNEYLDSLSIYSVHEYSNSSEYNVLDGLDYSNVSTMTTKIGSVEDPIYGSFNYYIEIPKLLSAGYYLLEATNGTDTAYIFLQITKYQSYLAVDSEKIVSFVVDSSINKPAQGVSLTYAGQTLGSTEENGVIEVPFTGEIDKNLPQYVIYTDGNGESFALNFNEEYDYIDYYYYDYGNVNAKKEYWNFLYTDRTVYLPTDTIELFGFAQKISGDPVSQVRVVLSYGDVVLEEQTVDLSDTGTYQAELHLNDFYYGYADIEVYVGDTLIDNSYTQVQSFEKPTYKIETSLSKDIVMVGEPVDIEARSMFFEGTPVQGGSIHMSSGNGTFDGMTEIDLNCDQNGLATTTIYPYGTDYDTSGVPYFYNLYFTSMEYQKEYYQVSDGFIFFPRDIMVESEITKTSDTSFLIAGNVNAIDLQDFTGQLSDKESYTGAPLSDKNITVTIKENYYEQIYEGQYYDYINKKSVDKYSYEYKTNFIGSTNLTTDANGQFSMPFDQVIADRQYEITIQTEDQAGRLISDWNYYNHAAYYDYYDYYYNYYYGINLNMERYSVGDTVDASIAFDGTDVTDDNNKMAFYMLCKNGILSTVYSDDLNFNVEYTEDHISNSTLIGIYYDGTTIIKPNGVGIYYDYEKNELLNIDITTENVDYAPGDLVEVQVQVTDLGGNPVSADVNLSIVDEAYFALFPDDFDPAWELYYPDFPTGILYEGLFTPFVKSTGGGAEMGGGGDYMRSDFENTASFLTLTTDSFGKGTVTFNLPDNLTSWRITATAVNSDLKVGKNTYNVNSKLPFFINDVLFDQYISGDDILMTLICTGTDAYNETDVSYAVTVTNDATGVAREINVSGKAQEYVNIPIGQLEAGTYTIRTTAEGGGFIDGVEKSIEVADSFQRFELTKKFPLEETLSLTANKNAVSLVFLNEAAANHYYDLSGIYYNNSKRFDLQALAYTAGKFMKTTYHDELEVSSPESISRYSDRGLFKEFPYSTSSAVTTGTILKSAYYTEGLISPGDLELMEASLYQVMNNEGATLQENYGALWSLSILQEPVLLELYAAETSEGYLSKELNIEKLYTLLSLIELGDRQKAMGIFDNFLTTYGTVSDTQIYFTGDDSRNLTAMMLMAATELGRMEDATKMYNYLSSGKDDFTSTDCSRLLYLMAATPDNTTCSFDYTLDGNTVSVEVDFDNPYTLALTAKQAEEITFDNINGKLEVIQEMIGTIADIEPDTSYKVERTYTVADGSSVNSSTINQGDVVTVTITVDSEDNYFSVNDILPAGLVYFDYDYSDYSYVRNTGNQVDLYYYGDQDHVTFTYHAIAITKGTYTADYVVVKNNWDHSANYGPQEKITIQ